MVKPLFSRSLLNALSKCGPLLTFLRHNHVGKLKLEPLQHFFPQKTGLQTKDAPSMPPYIQDEPLRAPKKFLIETYGCQMNFNDTEVVISVLEGTNNFTRALSIDDADVILLMTCAIRENAESKIWARLEALQSLERRRKGGLTIGILGCMAERLKTVLMEKTRNVDVVCGPDAYRDLPRLLSQAVEGMNGINVMLSADETYADIAPVRLDPSKKSAFVSIMRGCNNMCAFCIVPFTRGRERSRPMLSILDELCRLSDEGVKEVTLLGQNVNSYSDESSLDASMIGDGGRSEKDLISRGFKTVHKIRTRGKKFVDLLDRASSLNPEMRIRFTSPHPKDFPDELLILMRDRPNICKQVHLPAQSGSNTVLERMRRGYTREIYLELVRNIRSVIPKVSLSSDFIVGFCGETEEDHNDSLKLFDEVGYDMAYMYAYSMREKTMAHRRYQDDIPLDVKQRRLREMIDKFYSLLTQRAADTIGNTELVLVEGNSKKSDQDLTGKNDGGRGIVFQKRHLLDPQTGEMRIPCPGDYVKVTIESSKGATPVAKALAFSSIRNFASTGDHQSLLSED